MQKKKKDEMRISLTCNIRDYTYTAHLSAKTGRLRRITAGCRAWYTWTDADSHYKNGRWSDIELEIHRPHLMFTRDVAARYEARAILRKLQVKAFLFQQRLRKAKRKVKKRR